MTRLTRWILALGVTAILVQAAAAQPADGPAPEDERSAEADIAAKRLLKKAQELLLADEKDRAVRMLETVIEQHGDSPIRYEAYLALGKHYLDQYQQTQAIPYLRRLKELERDEEALTGDRKEMYLEAMYLSGVAYFQMRQYSQAFPILRKITNHHPNTVWANQAYYYIGMCHFAQGNWNKAIRALSLVGTFVDPDSPTLEYVEAGRRFYCKVEDADLPVLNRLGRDTRLEVETGRGDKETLRAIPLSGRQGIFISSISTDVAPPAPGDNTLQVVGGDNVTVRYFDDNTQEGKKDVPRVKQVKVVSTGAVSFTMGTYESQAAAAFLGQPLFCLLHDADLDVSDKADTAEIRVVSRYKDETATDELDIDIETLREEQRETYKIRDEVVLALTERGEDKVHSGRFGGSIAIDAYREGQPVDKTDARLACALGDEVVATYVDELHIGGQVPREATASIGVAGEIDARPQPRQNVVPDPILRAKKNLVEATAYLELARIFKSMGLVEGAATKAGEGLDRVDPVIRIETPIPSALKEEAFKLKWELYIVQEDYASAINTCQVFNRLYPDSPFVDQALLGIGRIRFDNKDYREATRVFEQILKLEQSLAKAEAQYMIAQCLEEQARQEHLARGLARSQFIIPEPAIRQYKECADRYPDSSFAGESLAKLIDYYIETKDYAQASDLLDQVFVDYPDADFLDSMLLKWVIVAYRMGDYEKAYEKCSQLVTEYPNSTHAKQAHDLLDRIKSTMERAAETVSAE